MKAERPERSRGGEMTQAREGHRFLANWRKMVEWWIKLKEHQNVEDEKKKRIKICEED